MPLTRRELLRNAGISVAAGIAEELLRPLELFAAEKSKHGIRAHGLGYNHIFKEGIELHMLSFYPSKSQARIGVHYTPNGSTPLRVAKNKHALAVINGTFHSDVPLGCVSVDRKVLYEAPMDIRRLDRGVLYIRTDGTLGMDDFREKRELVDLTDPNADLSKLNIADWEIQAIQNFRKKHGFKKIGDIFHVGLPESTLHKILDEIAVGAKSEIVTKTAQKILDERQDIRDLLGGVGWLIKDSEIVGITEWGDPSKKIKRYAFAASHFSNGSGVLKPAKRTVVATKGKDIFLIATDNSVSLDKLARVMESVHMDNAVFLDGGGSSEMVLQGDDGKHRIVNSVGKERKMYTYIKLVGVEKTK